MLGEILPDLVLLAVVIAYLLRRGARVTTADRSRVVVAPSQRSRRIAAMAGSRRRLSRTSAIATPTERATTVESALRWIHVLVRGAPSPSLHQDYACSTREGRLGPSIVRVERAIRLHRRAQTHLFRELDERGILSTRPRNVVAGKAGAP